MLGPVMLGIQGTTLLGEETERLQHPSVGGVILFARNYENPEQLSALVEAIKALRSPALLIAVDQEGGRVQRFRDGFTVLPPPAALGRAWETAPALALEAAERMGWLMAAELRAVGIDFSFAPVLDIDRGISQVIGDRAFSNHPERIAALGLAWQRGSREAGMICVGKHFPGHGGVAPDSHHAIAQDERDIVDLFHADLLPFRRLIDNGLAAVMLAHVIFPSMDDKSAGFSERWVSYLRKDLSFQGAIFSDDLEMAGAAGPGALSARAHSALSAGCDMVIIGNAARAADTVLADDLPVNSLSALRLARLHGRGGEDSLAALQCSDSVRDARSLLADL